MSRMAVWLFYVSSLYVQHAAIEENCSILASYRDGDAKQVIKIVGKTSRYYAVYL